MFKQDRNNVEDSIADMHADTAYMSAEAVADAAEATEQFVTFHVLFDDRLTCERLFAILKRPNGLGGERRG
jgi:hypothetical protein